MPWLFAFSRQVFALSRKGFIPLVFSRISSTGVPYLATLSCCAVGFAIVLMQIQANSPRLNVIMVNLSILATLLFYIVINLIFIKLRFRMADHERTFRSSYGLWGPTYSISVYTIAVIFLCWGSSDSIGVTIAVFFGIKLLLFP